MHANDRGMITQSLAAAVDSELLSEVFGFELPRLITFIILFDLQGN